VPTDPRKRQKKQERHAAKRKSKQQHLAREKRAGLAERLAAAADAPVLHSWVTTDLWTQGLGWVCLSRELPGGQVAFAVFLVDRFCLGVKNVMADITGRFTYDSQIVSKMRSQFKAEDLPPAGVRKLVESAVAYAGSLGLHPHPDYAKAQPLFGSIDPAAYPDEFEFGKDGKPLFVAGPNDTPERCRRILNALVQSCGPDGFHYLIPLADPRQVLPAALQDKGTRLTGPDAAGDVGDQDVDLADDPGPEGGWS
jgi:hypothetical protein